MPYPNSQTPVTLRLNELFGRPNTLPAGAETDLRDRSQPLADLAIKAQWNVVAGPQHSVGWEHINAWPKDQQMNLRRYMILSVTRGIPMDFDWHTDSMTAIDVVLFQGRIGVTFRSPLVYPPYWGP